MTEIKHRVSTVLIVALLIMPLVSSAQTDRRGAFEFTELYTQRLIEYMETNMPEYDHYVSGFGVVLEFDDTYHLSMSAGSMRIRKDDFTIGDFRADFMELNASEAKNKEYITRSVIAFSALEYNDTQDDVFSLSYQWNPAWEENAVKQAFRIFTETIFPIVNESGFWERLKAGEKIEVYSGNYTYSIEYYAPSMEDGPQRTDGKQLEFVYLVAEEN